MVVSKLSDIQGLFLTDIFEIVAIHEKVREIDC